MSEQREEPLFSLAPNHHNGVPIPPPAQPYVPPTTEPSPVRVSYRGQVIARAVDAAPDSGLLQRQQDGEARGKNLVASRTLSYVDAEGRTRYFTPDDRRQQQRIEDAYAARERWRAETGQDYVPSRAQWARGEYGPPGKEE